MYIFFRQQVCKNKSKINIKQNLKMHLLKRRRHKSLNIFTPRTSLLQLWTLVLDTVFLKQFLHLCSNNLCFDIKL